MRPLPAFDNVLTALMRFDDGETSAADDIVALRGDLHRSTPDLLPGQYPEIGDKRFHQRLQRVRDLYVLRDPAAVLHDAGATGKPLTRAQRFVTTYLQPHSGYNGLLLVHATGSGKSCAAISVAEMYRSVTAKPALVLTKGAVRNEFVKDLGSPDSATHGPEGWTMPVTCAGSAYRKVLASIKNPDPARMRETMERMIRRNYTFLGYEAFANAAQRTEAADGVEGLRGEYSDRVIIVDEAHSLRSDDASKRSSDLLLKILRTCTNIKLVLMTATPMYDQPREIVFLLNMLRANDKLPALDADAMFSVDGGELVDEDALKQACTGYVSFVRSSDPTLFPTSIAKHIARKEAPSPWPALRVDGEPVPQFDKTGTVLVRTELTGEHAALVARLWGGSRADSTVEDTVAVGPSAQASNIALPTANGLAYGSRGLSSVVSSALTDGVVRYTYREHAERVFAEPMLSKCAPKIARAVADIVRSTGIQFVYSNWIDSGAVPLALALEERGITRYGGVPLLVNGSAEPSRGKYMLLTGRVDLMADLPGALREVNKRRNIRGERIKVVIASSAAMEGYNFRCIRDVHILDAWWNASRPLQVVGRAIRLLSHASLPPEERNVTLHYHAAALPGDKEGIDHHMYRVAAGKLRAVSQVMRILRDESVDCAWNASELYRAPTGQTIKVRTSLGTEIAIPDGSRDGDPECFFGKCTRPCSNNHLVSPAKLNGALFQPLSDDLEVVRLVMQELFRHKKRLSIDEILAAMPGVPRDLGVLCVSALLDRGARVQGRNGRGRLALYGDLFSVDVPSRTEDVAGAVVLDGFVEARRDATGDVRSQATEFMAPAFSTVSANPKTEFSREEALDLAVDAVLDRLTFEGLRAAADDASLRKALERGGFLRKDAGGKAVLVHVASAQAALLGGRQELTDAPPFLPPDTDAKAEVTAAGVLRLLSSARGRTCATLSLQAIDEAISEQGVGPGTATEKAGKCVLLELALRRNGVLQRPGWG